MSNLWDQSRMSYDVTGKNSHGFQLSHHALWQKLAIRCFTTRKSLFSQTVCRSWSTGLQYRSHSSCRRFQVSWEVLMSTIRGFKKAYFASPRNRRFKKFLILLSPNHMNMFDDFKSLDTVFLFIFLYRLGTYCEFFSHSPFPWIFLHSYSVMLHSDIKFSFST